MRGYELLKRWQALTPKEQDYVIQFFTGAIGCTAEGFTTPHADKPHADWALNEFEKALNHKPTQ